MTFELWDHETGNLVGAYATQDEALGAVRETVTLYGPEAAFSLTLGAEDEHRRSHLIAKGPALVDRALHTAAGATTVGGKPSPRKDRAGTRIVCTSGSGSPTKVHVGRSTSGQFVKSENVAPRSVAKETSKPGGKPAGKTRSKAPKNPPGRSTRKAK